jgi:hypothetical protein
LDTIWSKGTGIVCAACLLSMLRGSERCPVHVACCFLCFFGVCKRESFVSTYMCV